MQRRVVRLTARPAPLGARQLGAEGGLFWHLEDLRLQGDVKMEPLQLPPLRQSRDVPPRPRHRPLLETCTKRTGRCCDQRLRPLARFPRLGRLRASSA